MKRTLSTYEVAGLLMSDEYAKWTRNAAYALAEYYENLEQETGEEIEFCPVAIRCDWSEYDTLQEIAQNYNPELTEDDEILEYLQDYTDVIEIPNGNGYLVRNF